MRKLIIYIWCLSACSLPASIAMAQTAIVPIGKVQITPDQGIMFEAEAKAVKRDFKGAEELYDQVIAANNSNIEAYIQRGIVRRQLGDTAGTQSDGKMAATLANSALTLNPRDPNLYYKRGMGFRLMRNYDQAKQDIITGIRLGGPQAWQTDLQAIDFERKAGE